MGSACCVAARDRNVANGSPSEILHRNIRHSPSWSFRWDNRVRVVGEDTSLNWISDGVSRERRSDNKPGPTMETAYASEEGSPMDSFRSLVWQKSPVAEGNNGFVRLPTADPSISINPAVVKEPVESPAVSFSSPVKLSPSAPSVSSLSTSPLSSQSHPLPASSTPSRWHRRSSPGHQLSRQVSDSLIPTIKSPTLSVSEDASSFVLPGWSHESTRGSHGGSSDSWSIPTFPDMMTASRRERWSFDSETLGFVRDKIGRSSGRSSGHPFELQTCGICAKPLTEKIIASNEVAVVAVLMCGHVYHAECLENMTPDINKYDPACPVCTYGEKQTFKMSEKALKAELDLKTRKRSRNRIADSDLNGDLVFDRQKSKGHDGRGPKMGSSSSMKSSLTKPFLKRHFSFGSKGSRSLDNNSSWKRGFFWARFSKD